jgi:predicted  nucleic acid-binding Zn-ribbon protein
MLESSRRELDGLRQELSFLEQELEALRKNSTELLIRAESSQTELAALQAALRKAESSLMSLEISFAAYQRAAEDKIDALSRENRLWKWGCAAAGILAVGFGTAFMIRR